MPQFSFQYIIDWVVMLQLAVQGFIMGLNAPIEALIEESAREFFGMNINIPSYLNFSLLDIFFNEYVIIFFLVIGLFGFFYNNVLRIFNPFD